MLPELLRVNFWPRRINTTLPCPGEWSSGDRSLKVRMHPNVGSLNGVRGRPA
jgi:hypothetical protein